MISYIFSKSEMFVILSLMNISLPDIEQFCTVSYDSIQDRKILDSLEKKMFVKLKKDRSVSISPVIWFLFRQMECSEKYIQFDKNNCLVYCCGDFFISVSKDEFNDKNIILTPLKDKIQLKEMMTEKNMTYFTIKEINKKEELWF